MSKVKRYSLMFIFIIIILFVLSINFLFRQMDSKLGNVSMDENNIKIANQSYNIKDIVKVELLDEVTISGGSGSNTPNTNNGRYKVNGDKYESRVYIYKDVSPFIRIITEDLVIVFNENSSDKTNDIYNELLKLIK